MRAKDITGKRFGRLVALRLSGTHERQSGAVEWVCACDCGAEVCVAGTHLRFGNAVSCGCKNAERLRRKKALFKRVSKETADRIFGARSVMEEFDEMF